MIGTMPWDWIEQLTAITDAFAAELEHGDLHAEVPSCPGWSLADLGNHLREVHLWAAHAVTHGNPEGTSEPVTADRLAEAYRDAAGRLIGALEIAGEDAPAWTFGADRTAGFWRRRQVHETLVHVYDAMLANGSAGQWDPEPGLAWDGVDEVVTMFYPRQLRLGRAEPLPRRLVLTGTDVDRTIELGDGEPAHLTATAAELLLVLWKRLPADSREAAALLDAAALTP